MTAFARRIRPSVQAELDRARHLEALGDARAAFRHLERAHVLGQVATREHVRVHGHMLRWALRQHDAGEALGQAWRLVAAAVVTWAGWVPQGNTGGADVSGLRPMAIAPDLQRLITAARRGDQAVAAAPTVDPAQARPGTARS